MTEPNSTADDRSQDEAGLPAPAAEVTEWIDSPVPSGRMPLSLLTNLRALSEDLPRKRLRLVLSELSDRVEHGESLPVAYSAVRDRLPKGMAALFDVGLARGRIDLLLGSYLDHARRLSDLRTSMWVSLAYPVLLAVTVLIICLFLPLFVVPSFKSIFQDFGTELPGITLFFVGLSDLVRNQGLTLLIVCAVGFVCLWGVLRATGGRALPQQLFRSIPCIGRVFRWASLAGFTETLAILIDMQSPLPEALRLAGETTDDHLLADRAKQLAAAMEQGQPPNEPNGARWALGRELGGVMRWAGNNRLFAEALRSSGEIFAARSRVELHLAAWLFEPVMLFVIAVSVGLCVIALFMPLIKLLNDLS